MFCFAAINYSAVLMKNTGRRARGLAPLLSVVLNTRRGLAQQRADLVVQVREMVEKLAPSVFARFEEVTVLIAVWVSIYIYLCVRASYADLHDYRHE